MRSNKQLSLTALTRKIAHGNIKNKEQLKSTLTLVTLKVNYMI